VWLKMTAIWLAASAISLAAYHWLIRPWRAVRWSMGMGGAAPPTREAGQWTFEPQSTPFSPATTQSSGMLTAPAGSIRG
jgi:glucan biosynthesis protein C